VRWLNQKNQAPHWENQSLWGTLYRAALDNRTQHKPAVNYAELFRLAEQPETQWWRRFVNWLSDQWLLPLPRLALALLAGVIIALPITLSVLPKPADRPISPAFRQEITLFAESLLDTSDDPAFELSTTDRAANQTRPETAIGDWEVPSFVE
jgi:hypothetical protein